MNEMQSRIKEHFPSVLLTLLSIVQALALELLWGNLQENNYPVEFSLASLTAWTQVLATLTGIVLIWVVYASNAMRFRWIPSTSDSVYPFFIGLLEFQMIDLLGPEHFGGWMILMAIIFGTMVWVSHGTMRSARLDGSNDAFFNKTKPARIPDFYPHMVCIATLLLAGIYLQASASSSEVLIFILIFGTLSLLAWQFYLLVKFWEESLDFDT